MRLRGTNLLFLLGFSSVLCGQTLEIFTGPTINSLYSGGKSTAYETSYSNQMGFAFGFGVEDIRWEQIHMRFTLNYESYGGEIDEMRAGITSSSVTKVEFRKSILTGGIYPLNFFIFNCVDLNAGFIFSRYLNEDISGKIRGNSLTHLGSTYYNNPYSTNIDDGDDKLSSTWNFGLQARITYNIQMEKNVVLAPYYSFYIGLTDEFNDILEGTKSMRHYFGIVFKVPLKSSSPSPA